MRKIVIATVLSGTLTCSAVKAETRQECELNLRPQTRTSATAGLGGATGGFGGLFAGAAACSGFLGLALLDAGISFGTCVTAVAAFGTAAGAVVGTAVAEEANKTDTQRCASLPDVSASLKKETRAE